MARREVSARARGSMVVGLLVWEAHGRGRRSAISKLKSRNVMATKNFIKKGRRAELMGLKGNG